MEIKKLGPIEYYFGSFDPKCFDNANVWYEYYDPIELVVFKNESSESWIESQIYSKIDGDTEMYYTKKDEILNDREFCFISCAVEIKGKLFDGYTSLVEGEVTTLKIFIEGKSVPFYTSSMVAMEDNNSNLEDLSNKLNLDLRDVDGFLLKYDDDVRNQFGLKEVFDIKVAT